MDKKGTDGQAISCASDGLVNPQLQLYIVNDHSDNHLPGKLWIGTDCSQLIWSWKDPSPIFIIEIHPFFVYLGR